MKEHMGASHCWAARKIDVNLIHMKRVSNEEKKCATLVKSVPRRLAEERKIKHVLKRLKMA